MPPPNERLGEARIIAPVGSEPPPVELPLLGAPVDVERVAAVVVEAEPLALDPLVRAARRLGARGGGVVQVLGLDLHLGRAERILTLFPPGERQEPGAALRRQ